MHLPNTLPHQDRTAVWEMQQYLLTQAEHLLGPADGKRIGRPRFTPVGPVLRNTPNMRGAYAELSLNAKTWWPTVVFELAHETVHLLNPVVGNGNRLEEGIATAFSVQMQKKLRTPTLQQPSRGAYYNAWQWAEQLPGGAFAAAKKLRKAHGALGAITARQMLQTLPGLDATLARQLAHTFYRTPARKQALHMA